MCTQGKFSQNVFMICKIAVATHFQSWRILPPRKNDCLANKTPYMGNQRNFIIGILLIGVVALGFVGYSQNRKSAQRKTSPSSPQTSTTQGTTKNEHEKTNASREQLDEDFRRVDAWQKLNCTPKTRLDCTGTNCTQSQPVVYLILDRQKKTFSRCDTKGCNEYNASFASSGVYTNMQASSPQGMMIKVLGTREYIEIATVGLRSVFQHGSCVEIP